MLTLSKTPEQHARTLLACIQDHCAKDPRSFIDDCYKRYQPVQQSLMPELIAKRLDSIEKLLSGDPTIEPTQLGLVDAMIGRSVNKAVRSSIQSITNPIDPWVTCERYMKHHGIVNRSTVHRWVENGTIPPEAVRGKGRGQRRYNYLIAPRNKVR